MEIRFAPSMPVPRPLLILNAGHEITRQSEEWCWPFHQIVCCCNGNGHILVEDKMYLLSSGCVCFIKPNTPHRYIVGSDSFHLSWVSFGGYLADRLPIDYGLSPERPFCMASDYRHPHIHIKIMSILEEVGNPFAVDKLISVLFDIFIDFLLLLQTSSTLQTNKKYEEKITRAVGWIEEHIYDPINVQHFAAEMDMSRQHLARLFRQKFSTTPREFCMRMKIQRAQQELTAYPHISIQTIADKLGFVNYSHFTRVFREIVGTSPGVFRRSFMSPKVGL